MWSDFPREKLITRGEHELAVYQAEPENQAGPVPGPDLDPKNIFFQKIKPEPLLSARERAAWFINIWEKGCIKCHTIYETPCSLRLSLKLQCSSNKMLFGSMNTCSHSTTWSRWALLQIDSTSTYNPNSYQLQEQHNTYNQWVFQKARKCVLFPVGSMRTQPFEFRVIRGSCKVFTITWQIYPARGRSALFPAHLLFLPWMQNKPEKTSNERRHVFAKHIRPKRFADLKCRQETQGRTSVKACDVESFCMSSYHGPFSFHPS